MYDLYQEIAANWQEAIPQKNVPFVQDENMVLPKKKAAKEAEEERIIFYVFIRGKRKRRFRECIQALVTATVSFSEMIVAINSLSPIGEDFP